MTSETTKTYYESALTRNQRWLLDSAANLMMLSVALVTLSFMLSPVFLLSKPKGDGSILPLQIADASVFLLALIAGIILWVQTKRLTKLETAKIDYILESHLSAPLRDWFKQNTLKALHYKLVSIGDIKREYSWHYADEMTLHRISHLKNENQYLVESKTITPEDLKLIVNFGYDQKIIDSILEATGPADTQTVNHKAPVTTMPTTTDWYKTIRKSVTADLTTTVADLRQFIDTANLVETTEEEKHTIQRILTDSLAAAGLYQSAIISSKVLPNAEELKAEADAALHSTIHALNAEAEQIVTQQAATAMNKLRLHANYVASGN